MPCTSGITALHWRHDTKHEDACNGIGNGLRFKQLLRSDPDLTPIWNVLSRGELVLLEHLPARISAASPESAAAPADANRLEAIERQAILDTLRQTNSNRTETSKILGISRRALLYKIQRFRDQGYEIE